MRRGRPPYPDLLTPREQEVLDLLREGLTNQQIAGRLGIGLYGARYHVSEILSKLGVGTREEAAAWQPEAARLRRGLGAVLAAPFQAFAGGTGVKLAAAGSMGVAGIAVGLLLLGVIFAATQEEPEPPENLGRLVYKDGGDIWTLALPKGAPVRLTDDGRNHAPQWSPSGEWLLCEKPVERAPSELWVMRQDGTDARQVDTDVYQQEGYRWAPNDDRLAYITRGSAALVVETADGSGHRELLSAAAQQWDSIGPYVEWSPDGQWIATTAAARDPFPADYVGLWALRADGNEARELVAARDAGYGLLVAGWAPDGATVLYSLQPSFSASFQADGLQWRAAALDAATSAPDTSGGIAPEGMVLRYEDFRDASSLGQIVVARGGGRYSTERKTLSLVDFSAGVMFTDLTPPGFAATSPAWSPDSSTIAFAMQPESVTGDLASADQKRIWLIDAEGANQRRLNDIEAWQERPQWSLDGRYVLYVRPAGDTEAPGTAELWLHDLSSGSETRVLRGIEYASDAIETNIGYYGHLDWSQVFDWWQP
jgi:Tol biopolymer transport system component/DNA-binding CsgD family transcriptional regulator